MRATFGTFGAAILCVLSVSAPMPFAAAGEPENAGTRVVTFNIRYNEPGNKENAWANRKGMVAGTIRFLEADLAGLQEVLKDQIADLEALLPEFGWTGVGRDDGKESGEFNPIFYRKKRFDVLSGSTFWLSETPDVPGRKGWDAACPRIVTWIYLKDMDAKKTFHLFNTHFDHVGETARRESAALVLRKVREIAQGGPVIVTGDFNSVEEDPVYRLLTSGTEKWPGLGDARRLSVTPPYGSNHTFNGYSQDVYPGARIDFIFSGDTGPVLWYGVVSDKWDGRFVSDHNAVAADIVIWKK